MTSTLGLPLPEALLRLAAVGITPTVCWTRAPRRTDDQGEPRVVRASADGKELLVAVFLVNEPGVSG